MNEEIKKRIGAIRNGMVPDGYVRTEYGVFPSHWRLAELSEIAHPLTETAGTRKIETVSISSGVGFVNQAEKFGKELSGKQYEKYIVLHRGDFSYNKGNSNLYPQGCIYRLNDREIASVPNVFESFRIVGGDPDYYEQLFLSGFLNHQLYRKINHGVRDDGLLNLTDADFYSCVLPVPPIDEQHRIAEILSACDRMLALHQETLSEVKEMKKSFLNKMFPKDGACYPELRFVGFTGAWEQRKLEDIVDFWDTRRMPLEEGKREKGSFPYYGASGIVDYVAGYLFDEELILLSEDGANITDRNYPVCFLASGKYWVNNHAHVLKAKSGYDNNFICNSMERKDYTNYNTGMAMPKLNQEVCRRIPVACPSFEEQKLIGDYLRSLDNLITLHQREVELQQNKKKALMQLLLTGLVLVS